MCLTIQLLIWSLCPFCVYLYCQSIIYLSVTAVSLSDSSLCWVVSYCPLVDKHSVCQLLWLSDSTGGQLRNTQRVWMDTKVNIPVFFIHTNANTLRVVICHISNSKNSMIFYPDLFIVPIKSINPRWKFLCFLLYTPWIKVNLMWLFSTEINRNDPLMSMTKILIHYKYKIQTICLHTYSPPLIGDT